MSGLILVKNRIVRDVQTASSRCLYEKLYPAPFRAFLCREPFRCAELSGLYDAIANGLRGAGLQNKIDAMENEKAELISVLESAAPATVSLHPALADLYKEKIGKLANVLKDPKICDPAKLLIRELIARVDITYNGTHWDISIKGEISALVSLAQNAKSPPKGGLNHYALVSSTKVVAGVGFEPTTFRL